VQILQPERAGHLRDDPAAFQRAIDYLTELAYRTCPECIGYGRFDGKHGWIFCGWCAGSGVVRTEDVS
jgi:DnaJ-class molecular chaperone